MAGDNSQATTKRQRLSGWLKGSYTVLLFSGITLAVALILYLFMTGPLGEAKYVQDDKYQAVFFDMKTEDSGYQVYFGHVQDLNSRFLRLRDVFYIQTTSNTDSSGKPATQNTLRKLGCEVHGPLDEMIINQDKVIFWENLRSDGEVVKKIEQFKKENPNGQKCNETNSTTSTQGSSTKNNTTTTTPTQ